MIYKMLDLYVPQDPPPVCVIKYGRCAIDVSRKSARNLAGYNNSKTQAGYNITDFPFKSYKASHG